MESQKESLWPLALLGFALLALIPSKRNQSSESVHSQDSAHVKGNFTPKESEIVAKAPSPHQDDGSKGIKHDTPLWKKRADLLNQHVGPAVAKQNH